MSKPWLLAASFSKATTDEQGVPHLILHVNGPRQDSHGLTLSAKGKEVMIEGAKKGLLTVTPSHASPIELGKSADGWVDEAGELFVDNVVDAADHQAMKIHAAVMAGKFTGEVSAGGDCIVDKMAKEYTPVLYGVNSDNPKHQIHQALVMPNRAAYPDAGAVKAFLLEKTGVEFDQLGEDREKALVQGFQKDKETWDASQMISIVMQLESLRDSEAFETHVEPEDNSALDTMIAMGKKWIAQEILEKAVEEGSELVLSKKEDGTPFAEIKPIEGFVKATPQAQPIIATPPGATPEQIEAFQKAWDAFLSKSNTNPEPFEKQITEAKEQITAMEKERNEAIEKLAKAEETISAWKPLVDLVAKMPIPSGAVIKSVAFSKDKDSSPASGESTPEPPKDSLEATKQALGSGHFVGVNR